jgi:hypothetical protein
MRTNPVEPARPVGRLAYRLARAALLCTITATFVVVVSASTGAVRTLEAAHARTASATPWSETYSTSVLRKSLAKDGRFRGVIRTGCAGYGDHTPAKKYRLFLCTFVPQFGRKFNQWNYWELRIRSATTFAATLPDYRRRYFSGAGMPPSVEILQPLKAVLRRVDWSTKMRRKQTLAGSPAWTETEASSNLGDSIRVDHRFDGVRNVGCAGYGGGRRPTRWHLFICVLVPRPGPPAEPWRQRKLNYWELHVRGKKAFYCTLPNGTVRYFEGGATNGKSSVTVLPALIAVLSHVSWTIPERPVGPGIGGGGG